MMASGEQVLILSNCAIVDGAAAERREGRHVLIRNGLIEDVSDRPIAASQGRVIDLHGDTLMPGLIDCHVHVVASEVNLDKNALLPSSLGPMGAALTISFSSVTSFHSACVKTMTGCPRKGFPLSISDDEFAVPGHE